jgi:hypothetical protein
MSVRDIAALEVRDRISKVNLQQLDASTERRMQYIAALELALDTPLDACSSWLLAISSSRMQMSDMLVVAKADLFDLKPAIDRLARAPQHACTTSSAPMPSLSCLDVVYD